MDPIEMVRIAVLASVLAITVYTDAKHGKIYNKVVLPCIPVGILLWGIGDGWRGVEMVGIVAFGVGASD